VVGNGVDIASWRDDAPSSAAARLVFVGRLVDEKGWDTFLDVAQKAAREVPGVHAAIAGDGPRRPAVEAAVAARGLSGTVSVLGRLAPADVRVLLHGAILVNPTRAAEGFQLTLPEALAAGARIVSYAAPGVVPMRDAGLPVRVVPRGDGTALARAAVDELLAPTPVASVASLLPWDWSRVAARYAAAVEDTDR
jgi:glycosyltransferase involved in cell wall biosynthesis